MKQDRAIKLADLDVTPLSAARSLPLDEAGNQVHKQLKQALYRYKNEALQATLTDSNTTEKFCTVEQREGGVAPAGITWSQEHKGYLVGRNGRLEIVSYDWRTTYPFGKILFQGTPMPLRINDSVICAQMHSDKMYRLSPEDGVTTREHAASQITTTIVEYGDDLLVCGHKDNKVFFATYDTDFLELDFFSLGMELDHLLYLVDMHVDGRSLFVLVNRDITSQEILEIRERTIVRSIPIPVWFRRFCGLCKIGDEFLLGTDDALIKISSEGTLTAWQYCHRFGCDALHQVKTPSGHELFATSKRRGSISKISMLLNGETA
ncbi:hypothetical protein OAN24_01595 [Pseudodesulfovibrio sp.]|nr:hypothetical protein [Pseudodesulfovibrio sp.]